MEIIIYIWLACVIINALYFISVDEVLYKELDTQIDNPRLKDNPTYKRICYISAVIIICISGPVGTFHLFSK